MELHTRVPERELMDDPVQARAYNEADFSQPHAAFVDQFWRRFPELTRRPFRAIDLGCGPADVTVRFAQAHPGAEVVGVDGSAPMLELAGRRILGAGLEDRVRLELRRLPDATMKPGAYDVVVSNSLLHHLPDPMVLWDTVRRCGTDGAAVFVMDLCRPADDAAVDELVARYAVDEPAILQRDFHASLRAAFRPEEIAGQLAAASLALAVEQISDRHLVVWGMS